MTISNPLLELRHLTTVFPTRRGTVRAVDGMSFTLYEGEKLGIVGESGSGKSVTLLSIMQLVPKPGQIADGDVLFRGESLQSKSPVEMRQMRGKEIAMIFQDPLTTLNPVFPIGEQIRESLRIHSIVSASDDGARGLFPFRRRRKLEYARVAQVMEDVGIPSPEERAKAYPHQFSGGMQQRAIIAIALSCEPRLLLADEPTTALDVTIQAQIMDLLSRINREHGTSIVLVTHNLGLVAEFCEKIIVMYAGWMMEAGSIDEVIHAPRHPYTAGLLRCLPRISEAREKIHPIPGLVPDLATLDPGCPFAPRCERVRSTCSQNQDIPLLEIEGGRLVRCLYPLPAEGG
ncbi:MAG: ATP-binding cassette domain-containing protein [Anaerolineae bacterium]|nr:ATP-binding cassette domain-containing protein [Anaerolineae bacterium]